MIEVSDKTLTKLHKNKKIVGNLTPKESPVKKELDENTKATMALAGAIHSLAKKEGPKGESIDMRPMFGAIEKIQDNQNKIVKLLEKTSQPRNYEFLIERDSRSRAQKILVRESREGEAKK